MNYAKEKEKEKFQLAYGYIWDKYYISYSCLLDKLYI